MAVIFFERRKPYRAKKCVLFYTCVFLSKLTPGFRLWRQPKHQAPSHCCTFQNCLMVSYSISVCKIQWFGELCTLRQDKGRIDMEKVSVAQSCLTLCNSMDCSPPDTSVHGISRWGAIPFSRGSSWPRDWTRVSCITGRFFIDWVTETLHEWTFLLVALLNRTVGRSWAGAQPVESSLSRDEEFGLRALHVALHSRLWSAGDGSGGCHSTFSIFLELPTCVALQF